MTEEREKEVLKMRQVRIYMTPEIEGMMDEIKAHMPDLAETDIVRFHLAAALRASKENDYRITFPFRLQIVESQKYPSRASRPSTLNESKSKQ